MLSECNLCGGEIRERDTERCPWCLNQIENDADYIEDRYVDRSGVVLGKYPREMNLQGIVKMSLSGEDQLTVLHTFAPDLGFPPLLAHQLARWILGNVPEPEGFPE